jgi:microcystin degradation protein MlrC
VRIAIGQLWQETNTFNPLPTTRADFEQFGVFRGDELVERMAKTNELGGFIQSLNSWPKRPAIVGLVRLPAWPSGPVTPEAFVWLRDEMLAAIQRAMPIDGLLLALHGAMVAIEHPDVEGEILAAIRQQIGRAIPLVATLDLHANVTQRMVQHADVLVPYHTMPHVDIFETGQRAAAVLRRMLFDQAQPTTAFQKIPAVVPAERSSTEAQHGVAVDLKRQLQAFESCDDVLACGVLPVQPWLDIPELGSAVLVTTDRNRESASRRCEDLANEFWQRRSEYTPELFAVQQAVKLAFDKHPQGLIVLSDPADATTSGAPGDSVWILQELMRYEWQRPVLVTVVAPDVVQQIEVRDRAPASAMEKYLLGGVRDIRFGTRVEFHGTVERKFDARFVMSGHIGKELAIDMGRSAVLRQGEIRVVVTTHSGPHFAPELFQAAGFDPFAAAVLVAKSPCGFRAVYESRAAAIYSVKAPGCAPSDFWNYEYRQIPRPLWPWDEISEWRARPQIH